MRTDVHRREAIYVDPSVSAKSRSIDKLVLSQLGKSIGTYFHITQPGFPGTSASHMESVLPGLPLPANPDLGPSTHIASKQTLQQSQGGLGVDPIIN